MKKKSLKNDRFRSWSCRLLLLSQFFLAAGLLADERTEDAVESLRYYCFECHDEASRKGNLNLEALLAEDQLDGDLIFENLLTGKMPPADQEQPEAGEKRALLAWLANQEDSPPPKSFRRRSRHEFLHAANDLLGTRLDLTEHLPEDRGTNDFDSNRRIGLSREMLSSYFKVADLMLETALPENGFPKEQNWVTGKVRDSHETYRIYHRPYRDGTLFSWTRANNGNSYSFFYDHFDPPVAGWYELTFEAAKVAATSEDLTLQVYAGKYYYADDRPQPQRLVGVISLGNKEPESRSIRAFLHPGESVSVHCFSPHNFRHKHPKEGIYIKQLKARGPLPPSRDWSQEAGPPENLKRAIRSLAERAFASEFSDEELAPYYDPALKRLAQDGHFGEAAKIGFKAVLCSPRFLMIPGDHARPSHANAAHLARALWLSVPDQKLLALAAADKLQGETLRSQIRRMLADPRSKPMIRSFSDQWLNLQDLDKVTPSLKLYPLYDDLLNYFLPLETRSYLQHLLQENLPAARLIDSDFTFLNQRLARHYGIEGVVGQEMRKVILPPDSPRGGLLTMASILKVTTDGFQTSPILRGAWISQNLVGNPLSPPPESVPALEPEHGAAKTLKEQIAQHKTSQSCYSCHQSIDPYGFALESFDATGQWRSRYRIKLPHRSTFQYRPQGYFKQGDPVDASGELGEEQFDGIIDFKKILLADEHKVAYTVAKKFFEYAAGHKPSLEERLRLWDFLSARPENRRLQDLFVEVLINTLPSPTK